MLVVAAVLACHPLLSDKTDRDALRFWRTIGNARIDWLIKML